MAKKKAGKTIKEAKAPDTAQEDIKALAKLTKELVERTTKAESELVALKESRNTTVVSERKVDQVERNTAPVLTPDRKTPVRETVKTTSDYTRPSDGGEIKKKIQKLITDIDTYEAHSLAYSKDLINDIEKRGQATARISMYKWFREALQSITS